MNTFCAVVEKLRASGIQVTPKGDNIVLAGNTHTLTDEQLQWIKQHKAQILEGLKAIQRHALARRLAPMAKQHHIPLDDLLIWYCHDLEDMGEMSDCALNSLVADYATHYERYTGTPGPIATPKPMETLHP